MKLSAERKRAETEFNDQMAALDAEIQRLKQSLLQAKPEKNKAN